MSALDRAYFVKYTTRKGSSELEATYMMGKNEARNHYDSLIKYNFYEVMLFHGFDMIDMYSERMVSACKQLDII